MNRVLDTNAILYLLGGKLVEPLPAGRYFISVISEIELLSYPQLDESAQSKIEGFLSEITLVGLTEAVKKLGIRMRREHQISMAQLRGEPEKTADFETVIQDWITENKPRDSSIRPYRSVMKQLANWLGHSDASRVTR